MNFTKHFLKQYATTLFMSILKNNKCEILIPNNNEELLINRCISIGLENIILSYIYNNDKKIFDYTKLNNKLLELKKIYKSINLSLGIIIDKKISVTGLKKIVEKYKDMKIIVNNNSISDIFRSIIEKFTEIYVYNIEYQDRIDFIHQRNSGINHIIAQLISTNKINPIFNLTEYFKQNNKVKKTILGRVQQNIKLFKKYKINYHLTSFASEPNEIKSSVESFKRSIEKNKII